MFVCICIYQTFYSKSVSGIERERVCVDVSVYARACQLGFLADASQIGFASPITRGGIGNCDSDPTVAFLFTITVCVSFEPN